MYYSTEAIARAAGISESAARYYLRRGEYTPQITEHRLPRHTRVYNWPESALHWVRSRVTSRPIGTAPNPAHWLTTEQARHVMGLSHSQLRRLVAGGHIRSRRILISTRKGARWQTYISATDAETYPTRRRLTLRKQTMPKNKKILLLRAWLLLLALEETQATRALAIWLPGTQHLALHTEHGQKYILPLDNPESADGLPARLSPPHLPTEDWNTALATIQAAITSAETHGHLLTLAADSIDLWTTATPRTHQEQHRLPTPAAHG